MEESFQKKISGYDCKFLLDKETLQITCLSRDATYELYGSFSTDNIPENIKANFAQSAQDIYVSIQMCNSISIEEGELCVGFNVGMKTRFFKLPLLKKDLDRKDLLIAELKKELE